ncbi:MAG: hypothetical protein AB7U82_27855 [Blastocatellales bacterium]
MAITAGSGTTIATDDIAGVHYQRVKLVDGTLDGTGAIGGDAGNGLDVDVTRIAAGENHLGEVGGKTSAINGSFTRPANTTQYAAGDAVSDSSAPITFASIARINNGSGVITGAILVDSANQSTKGQFELWLFDTSPAVDTDNAAFTPTDAECATLIGVIPFNVAYVGDATAGAGGNAVYPAQGLSLPFKCTGGTDDIFGLIVVRNAYTPVSSEAFTVRLNVLQD